MNSFINHKKYENYVANTLFEVWEIILLIGYQSKAMQSPIERTKIPSTSWWWGECKCG
jgi:hypothetical protein